MTRDLPAPIDLPAPLIHAVQLRGALATWPADSPAPTPPTLTLLSPAEDADWLWQLIGVDAHAAVLARTPARTPAPLPDPLDGITPVWDPELAAALRKLAHGLWLRTWWPASHVDHQPALDRTVLDAELVAHMRDHDLDDILDDPLADSLLTAAEQRGTTHATQTTRATHTTAGTRADYALAASGPAPATSATSATDSDATDSIAAGTAPITWQSVPAGLIDATEFPLHWTIDAAPDPVLTVSVRALHSPAALTGLPVHATLPAHADLPGPVTVSGVLDGSPSAGATATARLELPIPAATAWGLDWTGLALHLGAPNTTRAISTTVSEPPESRDIRDRVRAFARARRQVASNPADPLRFEAEVDPDDF